MTLRTERRKLALTVALLLFCAIGGPGSIASEVDDRALVDAVEANDMGKAGLHWLEAPTSMHPAHSTISLH
jgi:hypothetical protein